MRVEAAERVVDGLLELFLVGHEFEVDVDALRLRQSVDQVAYLVDNQSFEQKNF